MNTLEQDKKKQIFINNAKKFFDENSPIYAGCPNMGNPCFCTGACQKVVGHKKRVKTPFDLWNE